MGVYYHFVNHSLREFVVLSDLRPGGDKENAVMWCGGVFAYLHMPWTQGRYFGKWARTGPGEIESDSTQMTFDLEESGYVNVTRFLVEDMQETGFWPGYPYSDGNEQGDYRRNSSD